MPYAETIISEKYKCPDCNKLNYVTEFGWS